MPRIARGCRVTEAAPLAPAVSQTVLPWVLRGSTPKPGPASEVWIKWPGLVRVSWPPRAGR